MRDCLGSCCPSSSKASRARYPTTLGLWRGVCRAGYWQAMSEESTTLDHRTGHCKSSGLQLGQIATESRTRWQTRGGRVINLTAYRAHDRALADLGLKE
jgi:hypothetical protein